MTLSTQNHSLPSNESYWNLTIKTESASAPFITVRNCKKVMFSQGSVCSWRRRLVTSNASWDKSHGRVTPPSPGHQTWRSPRATSGGGHWKMKHVQFPSGGVLILPESFLVFYFHSLTDDITPAQPPCRKFRKFRPFSWMSVDSDPTSGVPKQKFAYELLIS